MNFKMSWTLNGTGGNKQISNWDDILNQLKQLQGKKGSITLDTLTRVDSGAEMLQVRTENNFYLITLGEIFEDEYQIRSYWGRSKLDAEMMILGDCWPERQLTKDFDIVISVFKEFFNTGNVSMELLS